MTTTAKSSPQGRPLPLRRSSDDRLLTGVAAGLAARIGVDPVGVRAGFVALTAAGGFGVLAYLAALAISDVEQNAAPTETAMSRSTDAVQRTASLGLVVTGALLVLRGAGLWFGDRAGVAGAAGLHRDHGAVEPQRRGGPRALEPLDRTSSRPHRRARRCHAPIPRRACCWASAWSGAGWLRSWASTTRGWAPRRARSGASGSAARNARRWRHICTTRCCTPSR